MKYQMNNLMLLQLDENPENSAVAATTGLLSRLTKEENSSRYGT